MASPSQIFAIGDVHGCAAELRTLLNKLPLRPQSTVVFLGDYIDRGPEVRSVIDTILELGKSYRVVPLKGNHEAMFLDFLARPRSEAAGMFIYNGGSATLASYGDEDGDYHLPLEHRLFFNGLQLSFDTEDHFFVHAGLPEVPIEELDASQHADEMIWVRKPFLNSTYRWSKRVVHGHSAVEEVELRPNRINIDTGCVYRGKLSAIELPSERVFSVARQEYPRHVYLRDRTSRRVAKRFDGVVPVYVYRGNHTLELETLNYSEFGMLARDILNRDQAVLNIGDGVEGQIGSQGHALVDFEGVVVRVEHGADGVHYAIRILKPYLGETRGLIV